MDVLIVEPMDAEVRDWLASRHSLRYAPELARDAAALRQAMTGVHALVLPAAMAVDATLLQQGPKLRAIGRIGAGPENIDQEACARAGIEVVRSMLASAAAEAEFMLGALIQMMRRLPLPGGGFREGREIGAATVGLIGLVPAARAMAQLLAGFGSRVVGYDPAVHASDGVWARWRIEPLSLRGLLSSADAVCVQLGYFSRYRGLLGERFLPHCKSNQVIVSITSGAVFDDAALARALDHGVIAAAWLDQPEPGSLDPGRPLADANNLFTSQRLAAATREARLRAAWSVARRIDELLVVPMPADADLRPTVPGDVPGPAGGPATR